jgi:beta-glucosidase
MIDGILDQMTLEEQVSLLSGADFWTTVPVERLGVPKIKVTDGPNGARGGGSFVGGIKSACFPCAISVGATWSPELAREMGVALAEEAKTKSARVLLAPTVNIHRSGLNGRNFECYSEDPHLTSELAVAYIEGVQSQGIAACIKHFAANESEIERVTMSSDVDERSLREIYFPPFEAAVKRAGVMAVMSSYNRLNGTYTSEHPWLLTEVLRQQWGFDGIVMSDWFGSHSTAETINAGLDLEMPGPARDRGEKLVQAVKSGAVKPETVRASAGRILHLLERVGAFKDATMADEQAIDNPQHRALIRRMGAEGSVLLKNDGILPLAKTGLGKVAVIGPNAAEARVMGGGSAQINAHYRVDPLQGIKTALSGSNAIFHASAVSNNKMVTLFDGPVSVEYFGNTDFAGPVVYQETLSMGTTFWADAPGPGVDQMIFSARLKAKFTATDAGSYRFGLTTAGLAKLHVNGKLVVNSWDGWTIGDNFFGLGNDEQHGAFTLEAGETCDITIDYRTHDTTSEIISIRALRFGIEFPLGDDALEAAVAQAADADVAIIFAGRQGEWDTEGNDLPDMTLPGRQDELIARVAAVNPKTIVVLQTGGPVLMPWLDQVSGVLQVWYPGQELGNSVADVLFGDSEPGGRLPQSFPKALSDNSAFTQDPLTYPGKDGHVVYREGVFVGYRHLDRAAIEPLFPFGFGLSYTSFQWSNPRISSQTFGAQGLTVEIDVTNTGGRAGSGVVQLYVAAPKSSTSRPDKELRAFAKLHLEPGETGTATLTLSHRDLCWFDASRKAFVAEPGSYRAILAANAADAGQSLAFTLESEWMEPTVKA